MDSFDEDLTLSKLLKRNKKSLSSSPLGTSIEMMTTKESWKHEKDVFELQLNQLQEQLVSSMVQNQQLAEEIKVLTEHKGSNFAKELTEEKEKRKNAEKLANRLLAEKRKRLQKLSLETGYDDLSNDLGEPPLDLNDTTDNLSESEMGRRRKMKNKLLEYKIWAWNFLHERLSDLMNDEDMQIEEVPEEQLSVKKLKENVARFSDSIQPIKGQYYFLDNLFSWTNPWLTTSVFMVYIYSLWIEMAIPLCFMLMLLQLGLNYLHAKGIAQRFTRRRTSLTHEKKEVTKEENNGSSISEKYTLVIHIATKVQNTLGGFADSLEKLRNLFTWQHEEATKTLFNYLLFLFVISCILPTNLLLLIVGLIMGVKFFLITPIYKRFPKVQTRYDDIQRLWEDLPTMQEREKQEDYDRNFKEKSPQSSGEPSRQSSPQLTVSYSTSKPDDILTVAPNGGSIDEEASWEATRFADRFAIPKSEAPLHSSEWHEGRRCTLMDKENPLTSMKHGRLYLTPNYLCFERNQFHSKKNIALNLNDFTSLKKSKPIPFMPGPGMAIEVEVRGVSKPYLFAAMMGRDEAFESIMSAGKTLNLSWSKK